MRLSRRAWAIVAGVLVLALGAGGFATWRYTNLFLPDRLCAGAVASKDAQRVLGSGRIVVAGSSASSDRGSPEASCAISLRRGNTYVAELHLRTRLAALAEPSLRADPAMAQPDRGAVGAFGNARGWLLMAPGCRLDSRDTDNFPTRDADAVTVDVIRDGQPDPYRFARADPAASPEAREGLARLAADFSAAVARRSGCGPAEVPDVHLTAGERIGQPVVGDTLCGVPGAADDGALPPGARQDVSSPSAPVRSCWVHDGIRAKPLYEFTGTLDTRYPGFALLADGKPLGPLPDGWRGTGDGSTVVAPCGSGNLTLHAFGFAITGTAPAVQNPAFRTWANATAAGYGCEPVAPQ
ncbi:hypothetical protein ACFCX4_33535 [Kitasatospora sp. NPDC056327]|uniref:hypothetical protein n=1 Tax=Kitasatospora sp. NPDC056327 TaxID=3345785 RepID=UPI0035E160E6